MTHPTVDLDPVLEDLTSRGYETTRLDGTTTPPAVATGGQAPDAVTDRPLSVEPLADATPLSVVAPLADAARNGRCALFVADPETAAAAVEVLSPPFLRPDEDAFYTIPDRIHLTDGTLAAVDAPGPLTWRRDDERAGVTGDSEGRALCLEADGRVVAALASVDALTCPGPGPDAFPVRYERGADKRFHVYGRDRQVGTFVGPSAMKASGFRPVPLPLVPDHHLRENAHLARRWMVAAVDGDRTVRYTAA